MKVIFTYQKGGDRVLVAVFTIVNKNSKGKTLKNFMNFKIYFIKFY